MTASTTSRKQQTGAYLLEALIGILIFALGVLGIVGLQAASLRTTTDSAMRAEAVFAANQLLGQMWADDETQLIANYSSTFSGQPYQDFATQLKSAQGGTWVADPAVIFDTIPPPSQQSHYVVISIQWKSTGGDIHNYTTAGVVGQN
jgi:hypothetical protein